MPIKSRVTEDQKDRVRRWVWDALEDGWQKEAIYKNESIDRAFRLVREGYVVQGLMREPIEGNRWSQSTEYNLTAWCPAGISVKIPYPYSFEELIKNTQLCSKCGKQGVETVRVAFANRVCKECEPSERKRLETPGWCD